MTAPEGMCTHLQGLPRRQVAEVVLHIILIKPFAGVGGAAASAPVPGAWLRLVAPAQQHNHSYSQARAVNSYSQARVVNSSQL